MLAKRFLNKSLKPSKNLLNNFRVSSSKLSTSAVVDDIHKLDDVKRDFKYFDNLEINDGVAVIRLNGPNKMNTISQGLQDEIEAIFREKILTNKDIKAIVFISSKSDNFIAGTDIDMIKNFESSLFEAFFTSDK